MEWVRTRKLWLPLMRAHFKKEGGGEWEETDLITFDFDIKEQEEAAKPMSFKEAKAALGSKIKKADGGK